MPRVAAPSPRRARAAYPTTANYLPERIERVVREMLIWRGEFDASGIRVEARSGVVTLSGRVGRERDAREACRLARSVLGVVDVDCQLEIR